MACEEFYTKNNSVRDALLGQLDGEVDQDSNVAKDDSQSVLNLRNLLRNGKIDKSQYVGGLATLVATGLISKSEFTRLKTAAN